MATFYTSINSSSNSSSNNFELVSVNLNVYKYNLIIIGDKVGKTTLLNLFKSDCSTCTNDFESVLYRFKVDVCNAIELSICEIPREKSDYVLELHAYKSAHAAILMYDITNESSFKS